MGLKIEYGDVFNELLKKQEANEPVVFVHGCNAQGVQGSGIAAIVKKQYNEAYQAYKERQKKYGLRLGENSLAVIGSVTVVNSVTQEYYGRDGKAYASYDAIIQTLTEVAKLYPDTPIYLPLIGGGLGGLDQKRLIAIFQAIFYNNDATLFLKE